MAVSTAITTVLSAGELPSLQRISQRVSAGQQLTGADVRPLVGWLVTYGVVNLLLGLAVSVILTGTLTAVVGRAVLGQQVTVSQAWQQARGRIGALAGLTLLILAIFVGMWAVLIGVPVLGFLASGPVGGVLAIPAIIGGIPLTIFVWVKMSLAPSVVVLERVGPWAAIGRSWRLTRKSFWRVFGIWIVAYLVILLAGLVLQVPFRIVAELVTGTSGLGFGTPPASLSGGTLIVYLVIGAVGGLVAATVTRPIVAGVAALLYVDLRMRREGLDMALQTAAGRDLATGDEFASVWQTPGPGSCRSQDRGRHLSRGRYRQGRVAQVLARPRARACRRADSVTSGQCCRFFPRRVPRRRVPRLRVPRRRVPRLRVPPAPCPSAAPCRSALRPSAPCPPVSAWAARR